MTANNKSSDSPPFIIVNLLLIAVAIEYVRGCPSAIHPRGAPSIDRSSKNGFFLILMQYWQ